MSENMQRLSVRLSQILDSVGASEEVRAQCWKYAKIREIADTTRAHILLRPSSWYIFGSYSEGTTIPGLESDRDFLMCDDYFTVIENIDDAKLHDSCLLILQDESTKPGYVKLQLAVNGEPQNARNKLKNVKLHKKNITTDQYGNVCLEHYSVLGILPTIKERCGPADTSPGISDPIDYVFAKRCKVIPKFADEWHDRERVHDWPTRETLEKMRKLGCLFVGKGHPDSKDMHTEWSISFSLQERHLMLSLNPTQHKCYILLKMIKHDIIKPAVEKAIGVNTKSISSYHCKTCLFYTIENTDQAVWIPTNLIQCTIDCLNRLLDWLRIGYCPNYFLPEKNLLDGLTDQTCKQVVELIEKMMITGPKFLFDLTSENVGFLLEKEEPPLDIVDMADENMVFQTFCRHWFMVRDIASIKHWYLKDTCASGIVEDCLVRLLLLMNKLKNPKPVTLYTETDVKEALEPFIPHLHLQIAQTVATIILNNPSNISSRAENLFRRHVLKCLEYDSVLPRLLASTFYLCSGETDYCEVILKACEMYVHPYTESVCGCYDETTKFYKDDQKKMPRTAQISYISFAKKFTRGCMVFLPFQASLAHPALRYEMYRSVFTLPADLSKSDFWFSWIIVDSQVYLYFLQYNLASRTGDLVQKQRAINRLLDVVAKDCNLGHRETAYNLLGWIFTQEENFGDAFLCFFRSWSIRPHNNAAKWHFALCFQKLLSLIEIMSDR